jgi:dethiobiotin synthetase
VKAVSLHFEKPPDLASANGVQLGLPGLFVTATDTEVGKTVVASAIAATLAARGERVAVFKPAVTGLDEVTGAPPDHELLRASAHSSQALDEISPYRFGPPLSPQLAAELAGTPIEPSRLRACVARTAASADVLVVEGVGGLLVPFARDYLVRDFARDLALPLIVVARPSLGTINHTLLTLESARAAGLEVAAVVFTNWPDEPSEAELSNRQTVAALAGVEVATLGPVYTVPPISPAPELPVHRWLQRPRIAPAPMPLEASIYSPPAA